jgi:ring-1,2-phenylacetyl-CoA epoxidase subunit PaaD
MVISGDNFMADINAIWTELEAIPDPELPVVNLVELGIIRDVAIQENGGDEHIKVIMTPTFSACPALKVMENDIVERLNKAGYKHVEVEVVLAPPWTSDWISDEAREKLREFGIAPPPKHGGNFPVMLMETVECPYCASEKTSIKNSFGPTPCKMIYYCNSCQQPFEQFKPL